MTENGSSATSVLRRAGNQASTLSIEKEHGQAQAGQVSEGRALTALEPGLRSCPWQSKLLIPADRECVP